MKIGIRAHDLGPFDTPEALAERIAGLGMNAVQLVVYKSFPDIPRKPGLLSTDRVHRIRSAFDAAGVEISLLGAYFNWYRDEGDVGRRIFQEHLSKARAMGASMVGTEVQGPSTMSCGPRPRNRTRRAFAHSVNLVRTLEDAAESADALIGIEGAYAHALPTPEKVRRLKDESGVGRIRFIFDLFNFLHRTNFRNQRKLIDRALDLYGNDLALVHCKDFIPTPFGLKQVAPGRGIMDYEYLIRRMAEAGKLDRPFILEGVTGDDIPRSIAFLREVAANWH